MTLLGSFGGFFFKKCTKGTSLLGVIKSKYLYIGVLLYVLGALVNIWVLKYMPYSVVLPVSAITYVWTMFSSRLILKEKFTKQKLIGIVSIIVGAILIGVFY
jgi:drug/metabolite transporter (DMT)-like permease